MKISGGFRIGDGNIVYLRNTKERLYVRVVRRCGQRVRKEDHQVDPALYDLGADLLVAAQRGGCL